MKTALTFLIVLLGALASGPVLAHGRGHVRFGIFVGGPVYWPGYYYPHPYYYPPYYYPPYYYPPVVAAPSPPIYIEQGSVQPAPAQRAPAQSQAYWYYCADVKTYYPYVKECPGGWQRIVPQPPPG